jgi:alanyl-tRNA synthetase
MTLSASSLLLPAFFFAQGRLLGIRDQFVSQVAEVAVRLSGPCDPQVSPSAARILAEISREESAFTATLSKGQKLLDDMLDKALAAAATGSSAAQQAVLAGADAFLLYDSFGFPLELTQVGVGVWRASRGRGSRAWRVVAKAAGHTTRATDPGCRDRQATHWLCLGMDATIGQGATLSAWELCLSIPLSVLWLCHSHAVEHQGNLCILPPLPLTPPAPRAGAG